MGAARETKSFALSMIMTSFMIKPSMRGWIFLIFVAWKTRRRRRNILPA